MGLGSIRDHSGWKDIVQQKFCNLELKMGNGQFVGSIDQNVKGSDRFLRVRSTKQQVIRTRRNVVTDPSDTVLLLLQNCGQGSVTQGGREAILQPGDFALCDTSSTYQLNFKQDFEQIILKLSKSRLEKHLPDLPDITAYCLSHQCGASSVVSGFIRQLNLSGSNLTRFELENFESSIEHLLTTAVRMSITEIDDRTKKRLKQIKSLILHEIRDPEMNLEFIFSSAGIGMRTVQRLFQCEGETLVSWVNKQRFIGVAEDLRSPLERKRSITDIAYSWGFKDISNFSRGFKSMYHMTPRQWRCAN